MTATLQLREQGFAVFEDACSAQEVELFRKRVIDRYQALGAPPTWANPPLEPASDVEISKVGLVFHKLGKHCPDVAVLAFKPHVVDEARRLLGTDMHLEYTAAIVVRGERGFFRWHAHVGGVDNLGYRKRAFFPRFTESERVTGLLYLDDLNEQTGTLLVKPRCIEDDTRAPYDVDREEWPGSVELRCRGGTVVLLEQCTWHAVRPKHSAGLRVYVAFYMTSSRAPKTSWVDESLRPFAAESPILASLLP